MIVQPTLKATVASMKHSAKIMIFRRSSPSKANGTAGKMTIRRKSTVHSESNSYSIKEDYTSALNSIVVEAARNRRASIRSSFAESLNDSVGENENEDLLAPFELEEVLLGPWLGSGEFSDVYEVKTFRVQLDACKSLDDNELDARAQLKKCEKYRNTGKSRYALKHIKEDYLSDHDESKYTQAASDLVAEAEFLSHLQHPHIIKIRGVARSGADGFAQGPKGYFLIVDRLFDTLDKRIKQWRSETNNNILSSFLLKSLASMKFKDNRTKLLDQKLSVALQIAAGMKYLHSNNIMYRDMKPCNIGFDVRGDVKIFDFGLATIVPPEGDPNVESFEMSGAGSPRYMAPEVLRNDAYNLKADVYSFSIVLWEMLSCKTPFAFVRSKEELVDFVANDKGRPTIDRSWPDQIQVMMQCSFDDEAWKRPKMELFFDVIRKQLALLRGDENGLRDSFINRRRSFVSLRDELVGQ